MPELTITTEQQAAMTTAFTEALGAMSEEQRAELQRMAEQSVAQSAKIAQAVGPWVRGLELQNEASEVFAAADLVAHRSALEKLVPVAQAALADAERAAADAKEAVAEARKIEQRAGDRAHEASEFAREAGEQVLDLAESEAPPADQVEARMRADHAAQVAAKGRATAQAAAERRAGLEAEVATTAAAVRTARAALRASEQAVQDAASTVRPSEIRLLRDWPQLLSSGVALTPEELALVRSVIMHFASLTGADRMIKVQALEQARAERREEFDRALATIPAPTSGNIALPLKAQRDPRADWRR